MKREIMKYVSKCDTCRRVNADHLRPSENLQSLSILKWKWENICMNFIVGLSHTSRGYNSIWVIVDRLTNSAHFIPVSTTCRIRQYTELYMSHIIHNHGIPKTIISDRGSIFVVCFFENNYITVWASISFEAQPIILRLMGRLNESINSLKICFVLVL
jgi:hypothetical protein